MATKQCKQCSGRGKHQSLGYIEIKCNACSGVGFTINDIDEAEQTIVIKKKKKKKIKPLLHVSSALDKIRETVINNDGL